MEENPMNSKLFLTFLSFIVVFVFLVSPYTLAKIDPNTVVGMWLFEEGRGRCC